MPDDTTAYQPHDLATPKGRATIPAWLAEEGQPYRGDRAEAALHDALALLDRLDKPHTIKVHDSGWEIQHAITCRDDMHGCPVNVACVEARWSGPPKPNGVYRIEVVDGRPVLMEPPVTAPTEEAHNA